MRYLAIDLGTKRCGVAISDRTNTLACPYNTIAFKNYNELGNEINYIISENNITDFIVGYPKNMDGSSGFATKRFDELKDYIDTKNIKIHLVDERLSTVFAQSLLHSAGKNEKNSKKIIDTVSATVILDTFMKGIQNGK